MPPSDPPRDRERGERCESCDHAANLGFAVPDPSPARRAGQEEVEGDLFTCCGVTAPYEEMCAEVHGTCGGTGSVDCHCGGDFCVCHNHGEVECYGCEDCEGDDERDDETE